MTVQELCRQYKCNESGIYHKIRRNIEKLDGHIIKKNGKIQLDDYAAEFLIPHISKERDRHDSELAELKTSLRNTEIYWKAEKEKSEKLEKEVSDLTIKYDDLKSEFGKLTEVNNELSQKLKELESENDELKKTQKKRIF